jgi:hypothetical protein
VERDHSAPEQSPTTVSQFYAAFTVIGTTEGCPTGGIHIVLGHHWSEPVEIRNNPCLVRPAGHRVGDAGLEPTTSAV